MRKTITVFLLMMIALTSCNFPLTKPPQDNNLIATKVAETLSAAQTAAVPTPQPIVTQETIPPAASPSLTPEPTFTATPTATETAPATDPALTLGSPGFSDTFTDGVSFGLTSPYEDPNVIIKVENGAMVFKSLALNGGYRWRLVPRNTKNQYLEGVFKTISCSGSDEYGLVLRAPTLDNGIGYYFAVSCDGFYSFIRWDGFGYEKRTLLNWTAESKLLTGENQVNRLGVMAKNNIFSLYINGHLVKELTDNSIPEQGYIGAYVSAINDPGFTINVEEIKLWTLQ